MIEVTAAIPEAAPRHPCAAHWRLASEMGSNEKCFPVIVSANIQYSKISLKEYTFQRYPVYLLACEQIERLPRTIAMSNPEKHTAMNSVPPASSVARLSRPMDAYAKFIGTWEIEGDVTGTTSYQWLPGGYFIVERASLVQRDHPLEGLAVIGQARSWRGAPSPDVVGRFYDSEGNSIDYVYELIGESFKIWIDERGSDAMYEAEFEKDSTVRRGRWVYPGGTPVESVARKISASTDIDPWLAHDLGKSEASDPSQSE